MYLTVVMVTGKVVTKGKLSRNCTPDKLFLI